jgi:exonuclease VII small subunit
MDKKLQIKKKVKELDELVAYFEKSEDFDLEEGLVKYEKALELVKAIKTEMEKFELKIKEIEDKYLQDDSL